MSAAEDRSYWPSAEKRATLRQQGVLAVSQIAIGLAVVFSVTIWLVLRWNKISALFVINAEAVVPQLRDCAWLMVEMSGVAAASALVCGLAQSFGWWNLSFLAPYAGRIFSAKHPASFGAVVSFMAMYAIGIISALAIAYLMIPELLRLAAINTGYVTWAAALLKRVLQIGAAAAGIFAIFFITVERVAFLVRHRMTRAEFEQEQRSR